MEGWTYKHCLTRVSKFNFYLFTGANLGVLKGLDVGTPACEAKQTQTHSHCSQSEFDTNNIHFMVCQEKAKEAGHVWQLQLLHLTPTNLHSPALTCLSLHAKGKTEQKLEERIQRKWFWVLVCNSQGGRGGSKAPKAFCFHLLWKRASLDSSRQPV